MADPVLVLVLVIGASPSDRVHGSAVSSAVADALGRDARVVVEDRSALVADADVVAAADRAHASAIAEVSWADAKHSSARLHVYRSDDRNFVDRELAFEAGDLVDDRDRAVGFMLGAMIREQRAAPPSPRPPAPPPPVPPPRDRVVPVPPPQSWHVALEAAGLATTGSARAASVGGSMRGHVVFTSLSVNAGASLSTEPDPPAGVYHTIFCLSAGGRWVWLDVRDVSVDAGVALLFLDHIVRETVTDHRWLMGSRAAVGVGWRATPRLEPFGMIGVDVGWGITRINVGTQRPDTIPMLRAVGELGLRLHL